MIDNFISDTNLFGSLAYSQREKNS